MRNAFINIMGKILKQNKNVLMLNGDAGYKIFQPISSEFKSQYIIYVIVLTGLQIEVVKDANPSGFGYNPTQQLWR